MAQRFMTSIPTAVVSRRGADRLRGGHPWVYRSDVLSAEASPGDLVRVRSDHDRRIGWAFWSSTSQIALRLVSDAADVPDERTLLAQRIGAAVDFRASLEIDATAFRLVHGEADRLPGLIVDRYADWLVIQTLCQ